MSEEDVKEGEGAVCFSLYHELDTGVDGVEMVMKGNHVLNGESSASVIDVTFPEPGWRDKGGECTLLNVLHDQIGHSY